MTPARRAGGRPQGIASAVRRAVPVPRVEIIVSGGVVQDVIVSNGRAAIIIDDRDNAP